MRSMSQLITITASTAVLLAAFAGSAQAQGQSQAAEMGRVISSTPLVQPNQNHPPAYNVVYEYAGKQYSVQMPRDPGSFMQLQVTPVDIPAPVIQPQTVYAPPVQQVVYAPAPVVYQQPYYVNPYIYPAISIGLGYAAYRGGYFAPRGHVVYRGGTGHRRH
jgi:hypothetical protein